MGENVKFCEELNTKDSSLAGGVMEDLEGDEVVVGGELGEEVSPLDGGDAGGYVNGQPVVF